MQEELAQFRKLSTEDIVKLDVYIDAVLGDGELQEEIWNLLYPQIMTLSLDGLYEYRTSYTKWFGLLSWHIHKSLNKAQMRDVLERVSVVGILRGEDVWREMMIYLHIHAVDEEDMQNMYSTFRQGISRSKEIIYQNEQRKTYRVSDFMKDMERMHTSSDTFRSAELFLEIGKYLKARLQTEGYVTELDDVFFNMKSLANFLIGVEPEAIYATVDEMFYPQVYEHMEREVAGAREPQVTDSVLLHPSEEISYTQQEMKGEKKETTFKQQLRGMAKPEDWLHTDDAKVSALAWAQKVGSPAEARKQLIDSLEKAIPNIGSNFEAVESVMDLTGHLKENGFEWEDLLYFDETTGQFSWQKE